LFKLIKDEDIYGITALHYASKVGNNLDVVKYRIENGAQLNLQDNEDKTALHYASKVFCYPSFVIIIIIIIIIVN
jgi:ankyrin repeat protein